MKVRYLFLLLMAIGFFGCGLRQRETALEKRETALNEKEQQLLLLEKQLQLKEEAITQREKSMDSLPRPSIAADTALVDTTILGTWSVNMRCTETSCSGSAVGDTKNETWAIAYQGTVVIAKAMAGNELVRIYTGTYTQAGLKLIAEQEPEAPATNQITVTLEQEKPGEMEGIREIRRPEDCHIIYALTLKKN